MQIKTINLSITKLLYVGKFHNILKCLFVVITIYKYTKNMKIIKTTISGFRKNILIFFYEKLDGFKHFICNKL